jgi:hypothetical protein
MSLNDRVGEWIVRHVLGPVAFRVVRWWTAADRPYDDPLAEHPYRVTAPDGIVVGGYPGTVEQGEIIWLQRAVGDSLSGSTERLPDDYDRIGTMEVHK